MSGSRAASGLKYHHGFFAHKGGRYKEKALSLEPNIFREHLKPFTNMSRFSLPVCWHPTDKTFFVGESKKERNLNWYCLFPSEGQNV
jgi:hypothetical protein